MTKPIIFISYSHKDEDWKDRLVTHLSVLQQHGLLDIWDDRRIGAGEDWYQEIQAAMSVACVAILLVSANFLTSKFILSEEVPTLLRLREKEGLKIFPVIARPCLWKHVEWLTKMQLRPLDGSPLSGMNSHYIDVNLTSISEEVLALITQYKKTDKDQCILEKKTNRITDSLDQDQSLPYEHSTSFFAGRFARAFPGVRGIEWFDSPKGAIKRLSRLLEEPLEISGPANSTRYCYNPIWWSRGGRDMSIEYFKQLDENKILIDHQEIEVARIAAVNMRAYYQCFVYLEANPMEQTGIYKFTNDHIEELKAKFGYFWEEYGIYRGKHIVNRAEFDDGAAVINGELIDFNSEVELRIRYLTPYNLVISAKDCPINSRNFEERFEEMMNNILRKPTNFNQFVDEILRLPKLHN
jgi:hypothetical protein